MLKTRKLIVAALHIALGIVLPMAFHSIPNAGGIFLPMHIPVLMCGIICGFPYGVACGIAAPVISGILTGMPPAALLPSMLCELCVYGAVSGLLTQFIRTRNRLLRVYSSLIGAMIAGRVVSGILNAFIFRAGDYSFGVWLTTAFVTALPGVVIQIALIPAIVLALQKAGFGNEINHRGISHGKAES